MFCSVVLLHASGLEPPRHRVDLGHFLRQLRGSSVAVKHFIQAKWMTSGFGDSFLCLCVMSWRQGVFLWGRGLLSECHQLTRHWHLSKTHEAGTVFFFRLQNR